MAVWALVCMLAAPGTTATADDASATATEVRVERTDGTVASGRLERIDEREAVLTGSPSLPVAGIRRIMAAGGAAADAQARRPFAATVIGADGLRVGGEDFTWQGDRAAIRCDGGRIELPIDRVRTVVFRRPQAAAGAVDPEWLAALPEEPESDLVVVARAKEGGGEEFEMVPCAITAVSADGVEVVLDEEKLPVKRTKVAGLHWVRAGANAGGGTQVEIAGGVLRARSVTWTPNGLILDGDVRIPATMLRGIDYAVGRTVRLSTLAAERTEVEPFFGALGSIDEIAAYFKPRFVAAPAGAGAAAGPPALVVRPRTVAVWRVPDDGRRFRTRVAAAAGPQATGAAAVAVLLDDREVFRRRIDATATGGEGEAGEAAGVPIDIDVAGGRRLTIEVGFSAGRGTGCAILFADPVFEK